jgi:hypothetical protein
MEKGCGPQPRSGPVSFVFVALMTPRGTLAASAMRIRERLRSRGDGELAFSAAVQFFSQGGERARRRQTSDGQRLLMQSSLKSRRPNDCVALTDTWSRAEALAVSMRSAREQDRTRRSLLTRGGGGKKDTEERTKKVSFSTPPAADLGEGGKEGRGRFFLSSFDKGA